MRSAERTGTLAILVSAVGYGFLSVLLKLALEAGARPLPLVAWRFAIGSLAVWALLAIRRRPLPTPGDRIPVLALGALYALNAVLFTVALQWVPASTATLVFYAYPVVVVALAAAFLGERITRWRTIAIALAVAGCTLTAGIGALGGRPLGIALVLFSMASLSVYIVAGRSLLVRLPSHGSAALIVTGTAVVATLSAAASGSLALGGGSRAALLVTLIAIVSTALPITLFIVGLKRVGAGRAAIYSTVEPVVTVAAAAAMLGERIAPLQYVGGALILAGVVGLRLERPLAPSEEVGPLDAP